MKLLPIGLFCILGKMVVHHKGANIKRVGLARFFEAYVVV